MITIFIRPNGQAVTSNYLEYIDYQAASADYPQANIRYLSAVEDDAYYTQGVLPALEDSTYADNAKEGGWNFLSGILQSGTEIAQQWIGYELTNRYQLEKLEADARLRERQRELDARLLQAQNRYNPPPAPKQNNYLPLALVGAVIGVALIVSR